MSGDEHLPPDQQGLDLKATIFDRLANSILRHQVNTIIAVFGFSQKILEHLLHLPQAGDGQHSVHQEVNRDSIRQI